MQYYTHIMLGDNLTITALYSYICRLVVCVAVVEDLAEIFNALLGAVISILLQFLFDNAHVHGTLDNS